MTARPRHPDKTLERLLRDAENQGWKVVKGRKYYKAYCPCPERCKETIHLTPSNSNYGRNKRNRMSKCPAWREGER